MLGRVPVMFAIVKGLLPRLARREPLSQGATLDRTVLYRQHSAMLKDFAFQPAASGWRRMVGGGGPVGWFNKRPEGLAISLAYYPPGHEQELHCHDQAQLTFQLVGMLEESISRRNYEALGSAIGFKPAGSPHKDRWGAAGAMLLTLSMPQELADRLLGAQEPGWTPNSLPSATIQAIGLLLAAQPAEFQNETVIDLLALARRREGIAAPQQAPQWLARVRDAIAGDPAGCKIEHIAEAAGIHRVYLARQFRRYFGTSPSLFRRSMMTASLINHMSNRDLPLSLSAQDAGFYDQSHAARSLRGELGINLSQARALFRC